MPHCSVVFVVVESERFFPIIGWGKKRLPTDRPQWADPTGKVPADRDEVSKMLHPELRPLKWDGDWKLHVSAETDPEGWQYSIDFPQHFHGQMKRTDFVRKRGWMRQASTTKEIRTESELRLSGELEAFVQQTQFGDHTIPLEQPPNDGQHFIAEIVQSQRYFPLAGWGNRRLPTDRFEWADRSGKLKHTKDIVEQLMPNECEWIGSWTIIKKEGETDEEGWMYAVDFPQKFSGTKSTLDFVRKRFWRRAGEIKPEFREVGVDHAAPFEASLFHKEGHTDISCFRCFTNLFILNAARNCSSCQHQFCSRCSMKSASGSWECTACQRNRVKEQMKQFNLSSGMLMDLVNGVRQEVEQKWQADLTRLGGQELSERREAESLAAARGSDRNISERNRIIEKMSKTTEPRQGVLRMSILSVSNVPAGNPQRRFRTVIRTPDGKMHGSPLVHNSPNPEFVGFSAQIMIADDLKPLTVILEEFNPKFLDVSLAGVSDTGTPIMTATFNPRGKYEGLVSLCSENLVYIEKGCTALPALDVKNGSKPMPTSTFTVKWSFEAREVETVGFCSSCGRIQNRCDC